MPAKDAKPPVKVGQWMWVLTKTTRVSEKLNAFGVHDVTIELPNGYLSTMSFNPDKMRPDNT